MASKFAISEKLLAYVLDLPEGARLGGVERVPCPGGSVQFILTITDVDWPEGMVELIYSQGANGVVSLASVTPVPEEE